MYLRSNKFFLLLAVLLACPIGAVYAEKADRDKPIHIESDKMSLDNASHVSVFEGSVELTQGTLRLIAEKAVVTEDADGNKFCVATGHLANFRQKRDEANEYVEGYGERIEYNTLTGKVDLFVRARVKRDQDDVRGDHITYNTQTEIFRVNSPEKTGRVRATLQPKNKDTKDSPAKGAETKPAEQKPAATKQATLGVPVVKASEVKAAEPVSTEIKPVVSKVVAPKVSEPSAAQPILVEPKASEPAPATNQPGN